MCNWGEYEGESVYQTAQGSEILTSALWGGSEDIFHRISRLLIVADPFPQHRTRGVSSSLSLSLACLQDVKQVIVKVTLINN